MRVALIGATGQLGSDLAGVFAREALHPLNHDDVEVCDHPRVREVLTDIRPDVVINTSAFHNVDLCEDQVEEGFAVNTFAVRNLAQLCRELGCVLVHFSTDYVFSGEKGSPNAEADVPNPLNVYGVSKLAGEHFIKAICPEHMIIRTSGLFGPKGARAKGGNFIETMVRLGNEREEVRVVTDQTLSPTFTPDLASKVYEVVHHGHYGLYHITGSGHCSWYEFARRIFELMRLPARLMKTTSEEFGAKAKRPGFSVLHNGTLSRLGIQPMRHWDEALREYLSMRNDSPSTS